MWGATGILNITHHLIMHMLHGSSGFGYQLWLGYYKDSIQPFGIETFWGEKFQYKNCSEQ